MARARAVVGGGGRFSGDTYKATRRDDEGSCEGRAIRFGFGFTDTLTSVARATLPLKRPDLNTPNGLFMRTKELRCLQRKKKKPNPKSQAKKKNR